MIWSNWENKIPQFDQITVPAYIIASYANTGQHVIHTGGQRASYLQLPVQTK